MPEDEDVSSSDSSADSSEHEFDHDERMTQRL